MQTIPQWLVPAWNYGSAWTGLFDWDAWAALATATAAGAALWISGREERRAKADAQAADIKLLKALLLVFVNGYDATLKTSADLRTPEYRLTGPAFARAALAGGGLAEVSKCLEGFVPASMPSTTSVDLLMTARVSWGSILDTLEHVGKLTVSRAERMYPDMGEPKWLSHLISGPWERADEVLDAIADEIVRRGGSIDHAEDTSVERRLSAALERRN